MSTRVAESVQRQVVEIKPRNLFSCDKCRNDKKSCRFPSPWDDEHRSPFCNRCQKKGRTCDGPVYISRKLKNVANTIAVVEDHHVEENELLEKQAQVIDTPGNGTSHSTTNGARHQSGPRPMQAAWGLLGAVSSDDEGRPDPKKALVQLVDLNACRELLRSCLLIVKDVRRWTPGSTLLPRTQDYLESMKNSLGTKFTKLAEQAYADTDMKARYHSELHSILTRFKNPPTRPTNPKVNDNAGQEFECLFDRINGDEFDRQRRLGVYSAADHLCRNVCSTMTSGKMPRLGFDGPHLLLNAFQVVDKVMKGVLIPRDGICTSHPLNLTTNVNPSGSATSNVAAFPLSHFTLLQADDEILRRYARKDLKCLSEVDLLGRTIFHLAAYFGRTSFLESVLDDHYEKQILSAVKQDDFKLHPVMIAACRNDVEGVKLFVKHGANLNAIDASNQTTLDLAVQNGATDVVSWLLENGHGTRSYGNPLLLAVMSSQFGVLDVFTSHYSINDHHKYDDVIEAAKFAEDVNWVAIATALRELESNRPSRRSTFWENVFILGPQNVYDMPPVDPVIGQTMTPPFSNMQINQATPSPLFFDPFTPHMHGPVDPLMKTDQG